MSPLSESKDARCIVSGLSPEENTVVVLTMWENVYLVLVRKQRGLVGTRGQGSGALGQGSEARGQWPGVRGQGIVS